MMPSGSRAILGAALLTLSQFPSAFAIPPPGTPISTTSGPVLGRASAWKPFVSEYLGIPYAAPPVGPLRFADPTAFKADATQKPLDATRFGLSCPENTGGSAKDRTDEGEDCLTLNIWTKTVDVPDERKKAVMIWIYGGGFNSGKSSLSVYNGAALAADYDVVFVSVNYRTNVFGFPRVPPEFEGANGNPGLRDQRLAVEWVRDNIARFGGDPQRMVLFGQSAGGASVDMYSFAYTADPIIKGLIVQSGVVSNPATPMKNASAGWWILSNKLGCGGIDKGKETLACVRSKDWRDVLDAVERRGITPNLGEGGFGPVGDEKSIFLDYSKRRTEGKFAKLPLLVGNTDYERGFYENLAAKQGIILPPSFKPPNQDGCGTHEDATAYRAAGVPAWRYLYAGVFNNDKGAGHGAEIPFVLGSFSNPAMSPPIMITEVKKQLSEKLARAWTDFAKDPANALTKAGWPLYDPSQATMVRLGGRNSSDIKFEKPSTVDSGCEWVKNSPPTAS